MRIGDITITSNEEASIQFSEPGADVALLINNTSNTASSNTMFTMRLEGTNAGNTFSKYQIGNSDSWSFGTQGSNTTQLRCTYSADGDASPTNFDNLVWRAESTGGVGRIAIRSRMAIASGGERIGSAVDLNVQNVETDAGSNATINIQVSNGVAGGGGGNSVLNWTGPTDNWSAGVDKSMSNQWRIGSDPTGAFDFANAVMISTPAGEVTFPQTPAFLAFNSVIDSNVTGDGTTFTLIFDSEVFDQGSDFDGTSTFTAPVTGRYTFQFNVTVSGLVSGNTGNNFHLLTSNRTYRTASLNIGLVRHVAAANNFILKGSCTADMDAADTAVVQVRIDAGALVTDIGGGATLVTYFSGELAA